MKSNKKTTLALSVAVLALALTACSGNNSESSPSASASPAASASPTASAPAETPSASPSASAEALIAEGEFQGIVDSHSIEIKTGDGTTVFQVSPETVEKVTPWEPGTKVKFAYTEESLDVDGQQVKQMTITTIDKQ